MATKHEREVLSDIRTIVILCRVLNRTDDRGNRQRVEYWLSDLVEALDDILAMPETADA